MKQLPAIDKQLSTLSLLRGLSSCDLSKPEELLTDIRNVIYDIKKHSQKAYGIRTEKMFGFIAARLGNCSFIKQEDEGTSYISKETLIPDYRLILNNNQELFVEVKNCHVGLKPKIVLKEEYISKLLNYPNLTLDNLKIAVYWSKWKFWTLTAIPDFDKNGNKYTLSMLNALVKNQMYLLGDFLFACRWPLRLEFIADLSASTEIDENGKCLYTIKDVQAFVAGDLVEDNIEKNIVFNLILFGLDGDSWEENDHVELIENKLQRIIFEYSPVMKNEMEITVINPLSRIIATHYSSVTIKDCQIKSFSIKYDEKYLEPLLEAKNEKLKNIFILFQHLNQQSQL